MRRIYTMWMGAVKDRLKKEGFEDGFSIDFAGINHIK